MQNTYPIAISCTGGTIDAGTTALSGTPTTSKTVTTSATGTLVITAYLNTGTAYTTENMCVITVGTVTQTFSVTTANVPGAPTIGTVTLVGTSATVPFTAPVSNGGYPITSYTATSSPSGFTGTLSQAGSGSITVNGLTSGTAYTFTVTATTAIGTSSASAASNSVTPVALTGSWTSPVAMGNSVYGFLMQAVTYRASDGLFVAVGYNSNTYPLYATSTNGSTWTTPALMNNSSVNANMQSITVRASDGLFVAVGYGGGKPLYATSTTGSNWTTPAEIPPGVYAYAYMLTSVTVRASDGLFVAVGNTTGGNAAYTTSSNGTTWITSGLMGGSVANAAISSVTVNSNGLFVAIGEANVYATSSNGTTWTAPAAINSGISNISMKAVTVNSDGLFVAVGYNRTNYYPMYTSSVDGSNWSTISVMNNSTRTANMLAVTVNSAGLFVAVGHDNDNYPLYATSLYAPGAPTIGTVTVSGITATVPFTAPTINGGYPITRYTATSSPSGITGSVSQAGSGSINVSGLSTNTAYTFTVTATNSIGTSSASSASNSVTAVALLGPWTTPALMNGSSVVANMQSITVNSSGLFVAVGYNNSSSVPLYATSSNGSTWTTPALMNGSSVVAQMQSVTVNSSGLFVAVGFNGSTYPVYATSSNGSTWTTPALMNGSSVLANMHSITVNSSGLFVAVGYDYNAYPVYATSSNGSTWTTPALMNGSSVVAYMLSVTVNSSGLFVAIGYNYDGNVYPVYATSSNGSTWTTPARMNSVYYANMTSVTVNSSGLFVAVGYNNSSTYPLYATSSNGSTWTTPALMNGSSVGARMQSVTVNSSGFFVAVGGGYNGYPVYATSTDGSTWTTPALMNGSSAVAYMQSVTVNSSGLFVAIGYNGSAAVYATSLYAPSDGVFIDGVFSTYLYTGNGSTQTINNGVDLAGNGGLVWIKRRAGGNSSHTLIDSATYTDGSKYLATNLTNPFLNTGAPQFSLLSNGFSLSNIAQWNGATTDTYVSWTFRKAPKFFDVVTYTGTGSARTIAHNLGIAPGLMFIKGTSSAGDWIVLHKDPLASGYMLLLNSVAAQQSNTVLSNWTSTGFDIGYGTTSNTLTNTLGQTYVAYLFAHNTATNSMIQCGTFTTDGSGNADINLGWEAQYVLLKTSDILDGWHILDSMRGWATNNGTGTDAKLQPNTSDPEAYVNGPVQPTSTGFRSVSGSASRKYIYMAIRRQR
jgi:hypothetical protein